MSDYLPEGIVEKILLRLPIKCVVRCTAVSKSWRSLIKSSDFVQTHLSRTVQSNYLRNEHLLLLKSFSKKEQGTVFSLLWDKPEFGEYTRLEIEDPFQFINPRNLSSESSTTIALHDVVGTCNGLICLADRYHRPKLVWNPCIRKFVILPNPSVNFTHTTTEHDRAIINAFGYDSHSNDYKVVRIMCTLKINCLLIPDEVEVYSLARASWKRWGAATFPKDSTLSYGEGYSFVNGAVHWLASQHWKYHNRDIVIVSFDMSTESFDQILMPECLRRECCYISRYGESLALINSELKSSSCLHLWIMKEYGAAESWTKLFSICLQGFAYEPLALISLTETGLMVLERYSKQGMLSVDIKSKQIGEFGIDGHKHYFLDSFVGSMVLLDQSSAISY